MPSDTRRWRLAADSLEANVAATDEMIRLRHKLIYDITSRLEAFSLNTVIFMERSFLSHINVPSLHERAKHTIRQMQIIWL